MEPTSESRALAVVGLVVYDPNGEKIHAEGMILEKIHSNNKAEYQILCLGLQWCLGHDVLRLNVFGDSILVVKQIEGIWACKNDNLVVKIREARALLREFKAVKISPLENNNNK